MPISHADHERTRHADLTGDILPELPTAVALAGTVHRAEVGGNVCFNTVITVAIVYG